MRWNDSLAVGVEIIDNQHKMLFDLANDLNNSVNMGANKQVIDTLFAVIISYAFTHFETEENKITNQIDFSNHCYQHYQLLKQLHQYAVDFRNNRKVDVQPGEFLESWLLEHIKKVAICSRDTALSGQYKSFTGGLQPKVIPTSAIASIDAS